MNSFASKQHKLLVVSSRFVISKAKLGRRRRFFITCLLLSAALVCSGEPTWMQLSLSGGPSSSVLTRQPAITGYDATNNRLIVLFEGNPAVGSPAPEVWVLTNANGLGGPPAWTQLFPSGSPPVSNAAASGIYDAGTNRLIAYGGCSANCGFPLDAVMALTNANGLGGSPAWVPISVTNSRPRATQVSVFNAVNDQMISFGGEFGFFGTAQSDTAVLSNANGTVSSSSWTTLATSGGPPPGRDKATAVYDQVSNRMTIFGGDDDTSSTGTYNDVWTLSNANGTGGPPTSVLQTPTGGPPPPRTNHIAVYDSANNRMLVFGGFNMVGGNFTPLGDLWQLSNANGLGGSSVWTQLTPSGGPGPLYSASASFDTANQRMIVFGGADQNSVTQGKVWVLTMASSDTEPPTVTISFPAPPSGQAEYFNAAQTPLAGTVSATDASNVSAISCSDTLGGLVQGMLVGADTPSASASLSVNGDGVHSVNCTATDGAANSGASVGSANTATIKIDATRPTVTYSGFPVSLTYTVDQSVNITCTPTDTGSGVASTTCTNISGPAYSFTLGSNSFNATAVDNAGNTGYGSVTFTIQVSNASLSSVVAQFVTIPGVASALQNKLANAQAAAVRGDTKAMDNELAAFVNQVSAQSGKSMTAAQAAILIQLATAMMV